MSLIHTRRLALLLLLTGALAADANASPMQQGKRARCSECPRDSVRARRERLLLKIDSLRYEFEHTRLSDAERELLSEQMARTVMALQESLPEIAIAMEGVVYTTRGYLGVVFDGTSADFHRNNERIVRFYQYPRIALVEPSSPAERAGIREGDTLLALNGRDVREREISLTKLLVPDHRIAVRVRRDGSPKEFRVRVGEAPAYVISRAAPIGPAPPMSPGSIRVRVQGEPPPPSPAIAGPGTPPAFGSMWIFQEGIGGAKVETITEGLGRALGVKAGVLVIRAAPGTPAFESGLRDGDVIVRAAGKSVSTVRQLRGVLADADDAVTLRIVREHRQREVRLSR